MLPLGDPQFWTVTALAGGALWMLVRPFVARRKPGGGACAGCGPGRGAACRPDAGRRDDLVKLGSPRR